MARPDVSAAMEFEADEKNISPIFQHDTEATDDKVTPLTSLTYASQGTQEERALIFKQDLRIIPICSAVYLLCYLDRSNIGNAKVYLFSSSGCIFPRLTGPGAQPR